MSFIVLSEPGTQYGPCAEPCLHTDCAASRVQAATVCPHCNERLGYDVAITTSPYEKGKMAHLSCIEEFVESEKRRGS